MSVASETMFTWSSKVGAGTAGQVVKRIMVVVVVVVCYYGGISCYCDSSCCVGYIFCSYDYWRSDGYSFRRCCCSGAAAFAAPSGNKMKRIFIMIV
jgi:hypothetical protein